jgi:hypothetical protein
MDISVDKHIPINFTRFDKEGKKINEWNKILSKNTYIIYKRWKD